MMSPYAVAAALVMGSPYARAPSAQADNRNAPLPGFGPRQERLVFAVGIETGC